jgi:murein DD-endopeptidase MepM/ murein hydrolase activator NlpD
VLLAAAGLASGTGEGAAKPPKVKGLSCVERCAGERQAGIGATVRITGRRLDGVSEVRFPSLSGEIAAAPSPLTRRSLDVVVPEGAAGGRPRVIDAGGRSATAPPLEIVADARLPAPGSFRLAGARARPRTAFFDARRGPRLRYRFTGYGPLDLRVALVRHGKTARAWAQHEAAPFASHAVTWNGLTDGGGAAHRGRYRFRVGRAGGETSTAARIRFYDHRFPVRGSHSYGDRFGVPRAGGRTHEGQDVWAGCGTRLEAARGGSVQFRGYSSALYGHYLVIDGRQTDRDYMYAHLIHPPTVEDDARVRTGERIGAVGRSGNARGEGCQLHFELWPHGWHDGRPRDPLRELRRWDGWS